ncbi:MAG: ATPase domain-containing protein [Sediminispirochaetaceae bacterium]
MHTKDSIVTKLPTGIEGLDTVLEGGIPKGRVLTVTGTAGSGKTVLLNEFLYRGITCYGENGVFVTFEEIPTDIIKNVGNFGWDYGTLLKEGKLLFVDLSPSLESLEEISEDYELSPIILRITQAVQKNNAQRIVIDSIASLFDQLSNKGKVRKLIYQLTTELKKMGLTGIISSERQEYRRELGGNSVEEYVTDGVIQLHIVPGEQELLRKLLVTKLRGVGYRSGFVQFAITAEGLEVYPKIAVRKGIAETSFEDRKMLGIPGLDSALDGGIPKGHIVLVSGTTGSGKTLSSLQFLMEGIRRGEKGIYVALEEPIEQLRKTADIHGWELSRHEREGDLVFVSGDLIDPIPDKLLSDIVYAVEKTDAQRIVVDSISSIMSATMEQENVRQFLLQLSNYLKSKGITGILSYLMSSNFGAEKEQLLSSLETNAMRLSSVVDGVILLQYVERNQRVEKLLNVLKMRGCNHSKDIFKYTIETGGLKIGRRYGAEEKE